MVQIARSSISLVRIDDLQRVLLQRVRHKSQHLLIFVEQQHGPKVAQSLVREPRRSQELQTFYLAKMCSLAKGEKVQELRNIISPGDV